MMRKAIWTCSLTSVVSMSILFALIPFEHLFTIDITPVAITLACVMMLASIVALILGLGDLKHPRFRLATAGHAFGWALLAFVLVRVELFDAPALQGALAVPAVALGQIAVAIGLVRSSAGDV